jgi:hypothetical protein
MDEISRKKAIEGNVSAFANIANELIRKSLNDRIKAKAQLAVASLYNFIVDELKERYAPPEEVTKTIVAPSKEAKKKTPTAPGVTTEPVTGVKYTPLVQQRLTAEKTIPCTAKWTKGGNEVKEVFENEEVNLTLEGNCKIGDYFLMIYEQDDFGKDDFTDYKAIKNFIVKAESRWKAVWQSDGIFGIGGNPEYRFYAIPTDEYYSKDHTRINILQSFEAFKKDFTDDLSLRIKLSQAYSGLLTVKRK